MDRLEKYSHRKNIKIYGLLELLEAAVQEVSEGQTDILHSLSFLDEKFEGLKETTRRLEKDNKELTGIPESRDERPQMLGHPMCLPFAEEE